MMLDVVADRGVERGLVVVGEVDGRRDRDRVLERALVVAVALEDQVRRGVVGFELELLARVIEKLTLVVEAIRGLVPGEEDVADLVRLREVRAWGDLALAVNVDRFLAEDDR